MSNAQILMNSYKGSKDALDRRRSGSQATGANAGDSPDGPAESRVKSKADLLAAAYAAFNARNIDGVLAMMHPDVDWPNGMEGGRVHGHKGVRDYWERQWTSLDPRVEPRRFSTDETDRILVDVHQVVRDVSGRVLSDQMVQHVYTIEDNLIQRMDIKKAAA